MLTERLKKLRGEQELSQTELAFIIGVSQQTIGSWETGRTEPDSFMLTRLANYYKVSVDYILGRVCYRQNKAPAVTPEELALLEKIRNLSPKEKMLIDYITQASEEKRTEASES